MSAAANARCLRGSEAVCVGECSISGLEVSQQGYVRNADLALVLLIGGMDGVVRPLPQCWHLSVATENNLYVQMEAQTHFVGA